MNCRHCLVPLEHVFLDLGFAPPSNAYLTRSQLRSPELYFPLRLFVCDRCWLVQTEDFSRAEELFDEEYAYFSSTSESWLKHASDYCGMIASRVGLGKDSFVIEVAANDGYLLQNFLANGIPCLGIEPTASTATVAETLGIPVLREFFGSAVASRLAGEGNRADLVIGNNVYAHVPDINDFTLGLKTVLKPGGTVTLEFPHLLQLIENVQFDTVYHEHFSYLSLYTVSRIFESAGLRVFDVDELPTHGGSLRVYGSHADEPREVSPIVRKIIDIEASRGLRLLSTYGAFQEKANAVKNRFVSFLIEKNRSGKKVAAYGAAAKGCTLINYAGIKSDLLPYVCDAASAKQGKFLPGSHIPICTPDVINEDRPDFIIVLPWNISHEVVKQLAFVRRWGAELIVVVPEIRVLA